MKLVPFEYIEGPDHGVSAGDGMVTLDLRFMMDGLDALHRALSYAISSLEPKRREGLRAEPAEDREVTVWVLDDGNWFNSPELSYTHIVLSFVAATRLVRTKFFLTDCAAISGNLSNLRSTLVMSSLSSLPLCAKCMQT